MGSDVDGFDLKTNYYRDYVKYCIKKNYKPDGITHSMQTFRKRVQ